MLRIDLNGYLIIINKGGDYMDYSYVVILLFSLIICIGLGVAKFIAYDGEYDGECTDMIKSLFCVIDLVKDFIVIFCLLYYLLYGSLF